MLYRNLLAVVAVFTLGACNAQQADIGDVSPIESSQNTPPSGQVTAAGEVVVKKQQLAKIEHHGSKPQPKPGAQIALVENQVFLIEPGEQSNITLRLYSPQQSGQLRVTVSGSEGLNILSGATEQEFLLSPDHVYELPLQVLAEQSGRYYAHVKAVIENDARPQARVVSAIVEVGKSLAGEKLQKTGGPAEVGASEMGGRKDLGAELLIVQPARETILQ